MCGVGVLSFTRSRGAVASSRVRIPVIQRLTTVSLLCVPAHCSARRFLLSSRVLLVDWSREWTSRAEINSLVHTKIHSYTHTAGAVVRVWNE